MAWESYAGNAGNYEDEDIEFVPVKIGTEIEGTLDGKGNRKPNRFGEGDELTYFYTGTDGVKRGFTARKAVLERFDAARPSKGDRFKLTVVGETSKSSGRQYGSPTLLIDRASGEAASQAAEMPSTASAVSDDEPPF